MNLDPRHIPVAIVSLEDQHARRLRLSERGIPEQWVTNYWPGTDLRPFSHADLRATLEGDGYTLNPLMQSSVIGCSLSHGRIAEWQATRGCPLMLVLEDDVIPASQDFLPSLREVVDALLPAAIKGESFVCHLGVRPEQMAETYSRLVNTSSNLRAHRSIMLNVDPRPTIWRSHVYLISLGAAKKSSRRSLYLLTTADDWCARAQLGFFKRLYIVSPRLFLQDEAATSTIDHSLDQVTQSYTARNNIRKKILSSILFRTQIATARLCSKIPVSL